MHSDLVADALIERRTVGLNNTGLTPDQLVTFLMKIPTSRISSLTLSGINLAELPEQYLCLAVDKVKTLNLNNTCLTPDQLSAILCECIWSTSIEELNLTGANFTDVSSQLLMDAFACQFMLCFSHQEAALCHSLLLNYGLLHPGGAGPVYPGPV